MRRGLTWLIGIVVVCVVVLVAADRITKYVFENKAADTLGSFSQFQTKPEVALNGFPFLTQALRGVYDDAQISSPAVIIESGTATIQGATLDAHLYGAHISLGDMLGGKVDKIPVDRVQGYVVVPYSEMERLSGIDGLKLTPQGDQLLVEAPVNVPILGSVKIQALGTFGIVDGGLKLNVSSLKVGGINLPTERGQLRGGAVRQGDRDPAAAVRTAPDLDVDQRQGPPAQRRGHRCGAHPAAGVLTAPVPPPARLGLACWALLRLPCTVWAT